MSQRYLTSEEISNFKTNGVVLVKSAIAQKWIEELNKVVDHQLAHPGRWVNDSNQSKKHTNSDRLFTDRYLWQENTTINDFIRESGCAQMAAQAMESDTSRFYFDHLLIKEPGTKAPTPWHQDIPYWPFTGTQVCSIWVALTPSTIEGSALEFIKGSHLDNKYYKAQPFGDNPSKAWIGENQSDPVPDIEANRENFDIIGWDVEPGDALIFSAWTLHGARGNQSSHQRRAAISTRWLGDNAIWQPHKGADPTVTQEHVSIQPGEPPHDDKVFPCIWKKISKSLEDRI